MKTLHRIFLRSAVTSAALLSIGCFSTKPEFGGGASILSKGGPPTMGEVLESEPPPIRPDNHMDPVEESHGALSIRFGEDVSKAKKRHY